MRIEPDEIRRKGRVPTNGSLFFTIFQTFMSGPANSLGRSDPSNTVIPAKAGTQSRSRGSRPWAPAFAGATMKGRERRHLTLKTGRVLN